MHLAPSTLSAIPYTLDPTFSATPCTLHPAFLGPNHQPQNSKSLGQKLFVFSRNGGEEFREQGFGLRVAGCSPVVCHFGIQGSGFGIQGSGFRFQGAGFGVQGSGFRVRDSRCFGIRKTGFIAGYTPAILNPQPSTYRTLQLNSQHTEPSTY